MKKKRYVKTERCYKSLPAKLRSEDNDLNFTKKEPNEVSLVMVTQWRFFCEKLTLEYLVTLV